MTWRTYSYIISERKQVMLMTYYEIKKVFSKKGSKVTLIFIFIVISVVLSFIIGDNKYVNRNGDAESGISAMLKVRELKKNGQEN
mgnify:FL=1